MARLYALFVALLFGGTTALSFVAVPMLFAYLGDPSLAGGLAAKFFAIQNLFAITLALSVLAVMRRQLTFKTRKAWIGLALVAITSYGLVAPLIVSARAAGGNLALWHPIGGVLMLAQWALSAYLTLGLARLPSEQTLSD
jgi:hypothetical protein